MAYDEILAARVRDRVKNLTGVDEKKMFGGVGFLLNGNMACGVNKKDLIIRVGPDAYESNLKEAHTKPFDMTGRPMTGWIVVVENGYASEGDLAKWVQKGVDYASSLPPK
jgi:TfoX/Sxy family transcriptional regulator of competence genes